jgi:electron transport complex protein RnfC
MFFKSFKGGVHPPESKLTEDSAIKSAKPPEKVILPLSQHVGCECGALVKVGDHVKIYQKIADSKEFVSAPIHAPISGKVVEISPQPHPCGGDVLSIIIKSDGKVTREINKTTDIEKLSSQDIIKIIRNAGIVGLGGAMFPTHVKLSPPKDKPIDTVILNSAECEPYITADSRLMIENASEIIKGLNLIVKSLNAKIIIIGIEENKRGAFVSMKKETEKESNITIQKIKTKYPQGAEKIIIKTLTGRTVPSGGLPMDVGVVVCNVGTTKAVYDAVYLGKPLIERVVTVTGDVKAPQNLLVRIGTPIKELVKECGGYKGTPKKILMGGPMMGIAQHSDSMPIVKGTNCILVLSNPESNIEEKCIRCGKCVDVCPVYLVPTSIATFADNNKFDMAEQYHATDCIECGACAYICPSKIPLVESIRKAKKEIYKKRKK